MKIKALDSAATVLQSISSGLLLLLLINNMLEFVCAHAPYNMRGEFGGWIILIIISTNFLQNVIPQNGYITNGIGTGLDLLFIVSWLTGTRGELEMRSTAHRGWWRRSMIDICQQDNLFTFMNTN